MTRRLTEQLHDPGETHELLWLALGARAGLQIVENAARAEADVADHGPDARDDPALVEALLGLLALHQSLERWLTSSRPGAAEPEPRDTTSTPPPTESWLR